MRIVYGVHGYGRGHATRALAVLSDLSRRHDVQVLAGGDACDAMESHYPVMRIPTLGYCYRRNGTRSNWLTAKNNFASIMDLLCRGPAFQMVAEAIRDFHADAVISDAEPWTLSAARRLRIPRIGFDHFGIMAYCRPPMRFWDRFIVGRDVGLYRWLMGNPERVLVSSFYPAPPRRPGVRVVGTLLRPEVFHVRASEGTHLLAYFNKGEHLFTGRIESALRATGLPVRVYGAGARGVEDSLDFRALGNLPFLHDLASCRAVVSTAGNQLVGEALHFGKPMLVMPEDCVEQRINGLAIERLGIGMQVWQHSIDEAQVHDFLARESEFKANISRHARDSRREAVEALEAFLAELTGGVITEPAQSVVA